ncbi:MAG: baseplate wedge protein 53 [Prochlorococcus sp.]
MSKPYFNQVPDFNYVSRLPNAQIGDYIRVKNFFKRVKLREDIFQELAFFTKYKITGDNRPDNVANDVYGNSSLDWLILLANNILNIQTEWPMTHNAFDEYLLNKYDTYDNLYNGVHHYESIELKNSRGVTLLPTGTTITKGYTYTYWDDWAQELIITGDLSTPITNYEYETKIDNDKRNIYILKQEYLGIAFNDMEKIMSYKKGSSDYISGTLKNANNIKLTS